jgi:NitT/TauT family transport system substrate-binding protein
MKISRAALWLIVFLSGMTFGAGRAFAQKPAAKMTVSYSAAGQYINLFVAKEFGIFEKHGLDVTLNQINSSSQAVAALRSKSVDVAMGPAGVIFDAIGIALVSLVTYIENRFCNW